MGISLIIIVLSIGVLWMMNKDRAVEVEVAAVVKGNIAEYVEELGFVVSENKSNVFAPTAGKVTAVMVEVGDAVQKGDVLAKIDGQQLSREMMELEAKRADLAARYNEAVKPIDNREIERMELKLAAQKKNLQEAERRNNNNKSLYEAGAISYEAYHDSKMALELEITELESIQLELELLKKPVSTNIISQYEAQLRQIDIQMETLKSKGQDFVIVAPQKGTVMTKNIEVGSYLQPGTQIMEIGDQESLYLESDVLVSEIGKVKIGNRVEISHRDLGIEGVAGTVRKIHPQAFSKISDLGIEQKRVKVEMDIDSTVAGIQPGYDMDVKIVVNSREDALLIPENAIFKQNGKDYVFVNENTRAVLREIQKGIESRRRTEILAGLHEGEEVILSPSEKLEEGSIVKSL